MYVQLRTSNLTNERYIRVTNSDHKNVNTARRENHTVVDGVVLKFSEYLSSLASRENSRLILKT